MHSLSFRLYLLHSLLTYLCFTYVPIFTSLGYQQRNVTCAGRKTLEPAVENLCDINNKPITSQRCGEEPCEPQWAAKAWGNCSVPCGDNGTQSRKVYCEQVIANGIASIVDDQKCSNVKKPSLEQPCNQGVECPLWHTGPWTPVSKLLLPLLLVLLYFAACTIENYCSTRSFIHHYW